MNPEWSECRESVIELKEEPLCSEVFPQFLKYLYVGQIRISLQTVMPMLALADKYNIRVCSLTVQRFFKVGVIIESCPETGLSATMRRLYAETHLKSCHSRIFGVVAALHNIA